MVYQDVRRPRPVPSTLQLLPTSNPNLVGIQILYPTEACLPVPCASPPVTFDWATFTLLFPEFECLTEARVQQYFNMATMFVRNTPGNPAICILPQLLNLVTAHIAWLLSPKDSSGNPSLTGSASNAGLVGRISSATQGSVSVGTTLDGQPGSPSEQWYAQSQYGLLAFQAMAAFRVARYTVSPTLVALGTGFVPAGYWNGPWGQWA